MAYEPYVTSDYYKNEYGGTIVPEEQLAKALRQASRHIDTLTYNRIVGQGFSNLTAVPAGPDQGSCLPAGGLRGGKCRA